MINGQGMAISDMQDIFGQLISIIIPCYRSSKTLPDVIFEIKQALEGQFNYEVILVNDGSGDDTFDTIRYLAETYPFVHGIDLMKNCGQHIAILAGIRKASGEIVVVMDDDMQTHPTQIEKLVKEILNGYDVSFAKYPRKKESLSRRIASKISAYTSCVLTGRPDNLEINSFYAMKRAVASCVAAYKMPNINISATILKITRNVKNTEVEHYSRVEGVSGYTLQKLLYVWSSLLNYSDLLPKFFLLTGVISTITSSLVMIISSLSASWSVIPDCLLLLFLGVISFGMAMLSLHMTQMVLLTSGIPQYTIREEVGKKLSDGERGSDD